MSRTPTNTAYVMELHKLLADWGEGTSIAPGEEGDGAPATPNDATWRHRFFDTIFWSTQGGDFSATVSASQSVGPLGQYTWSSAQMVADVQGWLDNPASNFGWLMLGDESVFLTAKRFDTRESASPPVLAITYIPAGTPTPTAYADRFTHTYSDRHFNSKVYAYCRGLAPLQRHGQLSNNFAASHEICGIWSIHLGRITHDVTVAIRDQKKARIAKLIRRRPLTFQAN